MLMFKPAVKLLKAMSSNTNPSEICHAVALGTILGLMPKDNLLWYILFVLFLFCRIQRSAFTVSLVIATLLAPLFDPLFNWIGNQILTIEKFYPFYKSFLDVPFLSFTKLNNSIVMGSFIAGIVCYIPVYFITKGFLILWRNFLSGFVNKLKIVQVIKGLPWVKKLTKAASLAVSVRS